jgi:hypothetical protein
MRLPKTSIPSKEKQMASESYDVEIVDDDSREVQGAGSLSVLHSAEIDMQIVTAKKYPRSIKMFQREATEMVTLSEEIAGECMYALKRSGKTIEGPSARFAEVAASAWGNCRAGARVVDEDGRFVTAQGVFADVQRNVVITYEVKRRITDKSGKTYGDDMIGVTSNAACSIALRNAVLKGIPKAFWKDIYDKAKQTAIGNAETLIDRRTKMIGAFGKMGVTPAMILAFLEVPGEQDINLDHMVLLRGVYTSIKDGETTVDQAFEITTQPKGSKVQESELNKKLDNAKPVGVKDHVGMDGEGNPQSEQTNPLEGVMQRLTEAKTKKEVTTICKEVRESCQLTDGEDMKLDAWAQDCLDKLAK